MKSRIVAFTFAGLLALYTGACWYFSSELIRFKTKSSEEVRKEIKIPTFASVGLPEPENVSIQTDVKIAGWYFKNPRGTCGVVMQHGHTSRKDGPLKYASMFWERGCHLLLVDARYHGESGGDFGTYGYYEKYDLIKVIKYFRERTGLPPARTGLLGESMGAAISTQAAGLNPGIGFLILDSPYADMIREITYRGVIVYGKPLIVLMPLTFRLAAWRASFDPRDVSPEKYARSIHVPVLMIHAKDDEVIPVSHSQDVFQAIPDARKEIHITDWGSRHCRSVNDRPLEYKRIVYEFLRRYVPGV